MTKVQCLAIVQELLRRHSSVGRANGSYPFGQGSESLCRYEDLLGKPGRFSFFLGKRTLPSYTLNMRLFYAILFDPMTKDNLYKVQDRLETTLSKGSRTRKENLHLTLCFLGEREPSLVDTLSSLLELLPTDSFNLCFTHLGRFSKQEGDVLWAGVSHSPELHQLHHQLLTLLKNERIPVDEVGFQAHVTLYRRARCSDLVPIHPFTTEQCAIALMYSHQVKGVLTYTPLFTKVLH